MSNQSVTGLRDLNKKTFDFQQTSVSRVVQVGQFSDVKGSILENVNYLRGVLRHLFGRGSEQYIGVTWKTNLKDLLIFAQCNHFTYQTVYEYISELVSFYQNDVKLFQQECFKIEDSEDGIMLLMVERLKSNSNYLEILKKKFEDRFIQYLTSAIFFDDLANKAIDNTIKTLSVILKTKKTDVLADGLIHILYNTLSDDNASWKNKTRALTVIKKLAGIQCFDAKNPIISKIAIKAGELLSHNHNRVMEAAALGIRELASKGMLQGLEPNVIEEILLKIEKIVCSSKELLDDNNEQRLSHATLIICAFAQAGLLRSISFQIIKEILVGLENLLGFKNWELDLHIILGIWSLADAGLLKEEAPKKLEEILVKIESFLTHNRLEMVLNALLAIAKFAQSGILKAISLEVRERIFVKLEELLDSKEKNIILTAIKVITCYAVGGVLNGIAPKIIYDVLPKITKLLSHKESSILSQTVTAFGRLAEANVLKEASPNIIDEVLFKAIMLLGNDDLIVLQSAIGAIAFVGRAGIFKNRSPNLMQEMRLKVEGLLGHDDLSVTKNAKFTIDLLPETVILNQILPNGSSFTAETPTKTTILGEISQQNKQSLLGVQMTVREGPRKVPYIGIATDFNQSIQKTSESSFAQRMKQRTDRLELINLRGKEKSDELLEKMKTQSSRIGLSLKELEEKYEALEEACEVMNQTRNDSQSQFLNQLEKINQSCDEAKEKVNANLQLAQIQTSNEFGRETTIEKLKIMHNNFKEVADVEILGFQNFTNSMTTLNTEKELINQTVALIDKPDQV